MRRHAGNGARRTVPALLCTAALAVTAALAACSSGGGQAAATAVALPTWTPGASPSPAVTYPAQAVTEENFFPMTEGWVFKPVVDIRVTALGFYDDGQDGLRRPHKAAIFDMSNKQLLVSIEVQPQSPLDGVFRWAEIEPLVLSAGHAYVVAVEQVAPWDHEILKPKGREFAPEIQYVGYREHWGKESPTWGFPENDRTGAGPFLTANLKFKPVSAP